MLIDMEGRSRTGKMVHLHWTSSTIVMPIKSSASDLNMKIPALYHLSRSSFTGGMLHVELKHHTMEKPIEEEGDQKHMLTLQKHITKLP